MESIDSLRSNLKEGESSIIKIRWDLSLCRRKLKILMLQSK